MQEHLDDPKFEQNRVEYKTITEAAEFQNQLSMERI